MRFILPAVLLLALAINLPAPLAKPPAKSKRTPPPPWTNGLPKLKQVLYKPTSKQFLSPKARGLSAFRLSRTSEPPPLPMMAYFRVANSPYGKYEFIAQAFKPANQVLLFERSMTMPSDSWDQLVSYGPYPFDQEVAVSFYSDDPMQFVRANTSLLVPSGMETFTTSTVPIGVNPTILGIKAWVLIGSPLKRK